MPSHLLLQVFSFSFFFFFFFSLSHPTSFCKAHHIFESDVHLNTWYYIIINIKLYILSICIGFILSFPPFFLLPPSLLWTDKQFLIFSYMLSSPRSSKSLLGSSYCLCRKGGINEYTANFYFSIILLCESRLADIWCKRVEYYLVKFYYEQTWISVSVLHYLK